jgi:hypothetical protein
MVMLNMRLGLLSRRLILRLRHELAQGLLDAALPGGAAGGEFEAGGAVLVPADGAAGLQQAGAVGFRGYASSGSTNVPFLLTFDDYRVVAP